MNNSKCMLFTLLIFAFFVCAMDIVGKTVKLPNLIVNSGFEEKSENGRVKGWVYDGNIFKPSLDGHDSESCMYYENTDPEKYVLCSSPITLEPGECYNVSCWVRTEDIVSTANDKMGATFCLSYMDGNGKYISGSYFKGKIGTTPWTQLSFNTVRIPENTKLSSISIYVQNGSTGKAWFDDVVCRRYVPDVVSSVATDLYRNMTDGGIIELRAGIDVNKIEMLIGCFKVYDSHGKLIRSIAPASVTHTEARAQLDVTDLPVGEYRLVADFALSDGSSAKQVERTFTKVRKLPKRRSYIDRYQRLIVDGKPFFPLGFYTGGVSTQTISIFIGSPFNTIMAYEPPETLEKMDEIQKADLKIIYALNRAYHGIVGGLKEIEDDADEDAFVRKTVATFAKHPALIAWYTNDELPEKMMHRLTARQKLMEQLDPDHPNWIVLWQYNAIRRYMDSFDAVGIDVYPIPHQPIGDVGKRSSIARDGAFGLRPMWQVAQAFDWGSYKSDPNSVNSRPPTVKEIRCMSWQFIASGANGLFYYSLFDFYRPWAKISFEEAWGRVSKVAEEIKKYIPVILSVEPVPTYKVSNANSVYSRIWRKDGAVYLLLVNGLAEKQDVTVQVNEHFNECTAELGSLPNNIQLGAKDVSLSFDSMEVKLLKLRRKKSPFIK